MSIDISAIQQATSAPVLRPSDSGFSAALAGFNLAAAHRPDVVVQAATSADVATAVRFGAEHGLQVRVQATGHGTGVPMDGGLLISTAGLQGLSIDPTARVATVGAGVRWSDVISGAGDAGLATLCGSSPTVGVVGYTLGGGMGPMARTYGFASDRVRRLQMVTADGETVEVDPDREPDLFWSLRGGKPDVGIVTELEFDLIDSPHYFGGCIFYAGHDAATVLTEFVAWAPTMPESVTTSVALLRLSDVPDVPEPLRGRTCVQLRYVHVGDAARGAELLAPMRAVATPLIDLVDLTPAAAIASVHQDPVDPMPARDEALLLGEVTAQAVDALVAIAGPDVEVPLIVVELRLMGGALGRPGPHDSAVGGRHGAYNLCVIGPYPPPLTDAVDACMADVFSAMTPWSLSSSLINFQGAATSPDHVRAAWSPPVRQRLDALKQTWDPDGVFRFAYPHR